MGALAISVLLVWFGLGLETRSDRLDFRPRSATLPASFDQQLLDQYAGLRSIVVYVASDDSLGVDRVGPQIDEIADSLLAVPGVRRVRARLAADAATGWQSEFGPWAALYLTPHELRLIGDRISRAGMERAMSRSDKGRSSDPLNVLGVGLTAAQRVVGVTRVRVSDGYFTLKGQRQFFIFVELDVGTALDHMRVANATRRVVQRLNTRLVGSAQQGLRIGAVGRAVGYASAFETMRRDINRVGTLAVVVVTLLLFVFFAGIRRPLAILTTIVFGLAAGAAVTRLVLGSVNITALIFVGPLVGLGVDFGLHIATHYKREDGEFGLSYALLQPGRAILFSGLTTAAAFSSLLMIDYPVTQHVAALAVAGMLGTVLGAFTILPILLAEDVSGAGSMHGAHLRHLSLLRALLARIPERGSFVWVLVVALAVLAATSVRFELHPWEFKKRGTPEYAELERISEEFGSSFTPVLLVSRGANRDDAIEKDRLALRRLRPGTQRAGIAFVESLTNWLPADSIQRSNIAFIADAGDTFSASRFAREYDEVVAQHNDDKRFTAEYRDRIAGILDVTRLDPERGPLTLSELPVEPVRYLFEGEEGVAAISYLYLKRFPWSDGAATQLEETMRLLGFDDVPETYLLSDELELSNEAGWLARYLLRAFILAVTLVVVLLWLQFRSRAAVLLCLVPTICGLSLVAIVMVLFDIPLNKLTMAIAPLLVGIGLDDGIHVMERFRTGQSRETVFREVGPAMAMTTLTSVAAFACILFTEFGGAAEIGILGMVGMVGAFLAAMHALPPLAARFYKSASPRSR